MELLVAVDGSDESRRAIGYAADIAEATDGSLTLVHAIEPDVYDTGGDEPDSPGERRERLIIDSLDAAEESGRSILNEALETASETGVAVSGELVYGEPVAAITEYAEREGMETIYVGHRGRSERVAGALGSVARDVVERATVPVTVVQ